MSLAADLDTWATQLGTAAQLTATRDPDQIHPPCLFVDLPRAAAGTLTGILLEVPVYIVGWGTGKQAGDGILDALAAVIDATGASIAEKVPLTVGDVTYTTFQLMASVQVTPDTAPAPPEPTVPESPGIPVASNWLETGGSWQFDLTWTLSPDDGGSPILRHYVLIDGELTVVDGNTGFLGAVFSDHYPIEVDVEAVNAVGNSRPSTATIAPPTP